MMGNGLLLALTLIGSGFGVLRFSVALENYALLVAGLALAVGGVLAACGEPVRPNGSGSSASQDVGA